SGAANPHVPVLKLRVVSLSPTVAGRDLTLCRLKSHMAEELLCCERPTNANSIAENGPTSHHARLARDTCSTLALPSARSRRNKPYRPPQLGEVFEFVISRSRICPLWPHCRRARFEARSPSSWRTLMCLRYGFRADSNQT